MIRPVALLAACLGIAGIVPSSGSVAFAQEQRSRAAGVILWHNPGDIRSRNLFWGIGGEDHQPKQPVQFLEEDMQGSNPKFDVRDAEGTRWHVKMGPEARPEVVASRLLWAIGYCTNENYFLPLLHVSNMPSHLRRGRDFIGSNGDVPNVRLQRRPKGLRKIGNWNWQKNPFIGTREFNGLRVMMALIRNWDLYNANNAILEDEKNPQRQVYEVTDVGIAFGAMGRHHHFRNAVGNIDAYSRGRLVVKIRRDSVDLNFPSRPSLRYIFNFSFYRAQLKAHWIGRNIPRADAKWVGALLAQLSPDQIGDAFRAAGYSREVIEQYTTILMSRIQELNNL